MGTAGGRTQRTLMECQAWTEFISLFPIIPLQGNNPEERSINKDLFAKAKRKMEVLKNRKILTLVT